MTEINTLDSSIFLLSNLLQVLSIEQTYPEAREQRNLENIVFYDTGQEKGSEVSESKLDSNG